MGAEPSNMKLNILNHLIFLNPVQVKPLHPLSDSERNIRTKPYTPAGI